MVSTRRKDYGEPDGSNVAKQTSGPIPTFTLVPKLPPELRIEVWKMSMTPRLLVVEPNSNPFWQARNTYRKKILPVQFSVNCEARECALHHYNLRFTITTFVDAAPRQGHYPDSYHANVVMSSDDTLGLLGWGYPANRSWKFQAESVAWGGAWVSNRPSICGAPVGVKKVTYLSREIGRRPRILHALNSTVSWDVNSILHTKSTKLRTLHPPGPPWYKHTSYRKDYITMHSRNFSGTLQEWAKRLGYRLRHGGLISDFLPPDIMAFELGKGPEEVPAKMVEDWRSSLEGYYFSQEWQWLQKHPSPQGF